MFRSFTMTGPQGEIKRGALVAASLGAWSLTSGGAPDTWAFTARIVSVDAFHITQAPDALQLPVGGARWRWRGVAFEIAGDTVRATLVGPPEKR